MTRRHVPRKYGSGRRQVLVPGTRRAMPLHPMSRTALAYREADVREPAEIRNALRRSKRALARLARKARR